MEKKKCQIRNTFRDFPDGPVFKTLQSHCRD